MKVEKVCILRRCVSSPFETLLADHSTVGSWHAVLESPHPSVCILPPWLLMATEYHTQKCTQYQGEGIQVTCQNQLTWSMHTLHMSSPPNSELQGHGGATLD